MNAPPANQPPPVTAPPTEKSGSSDHVLRSPVWVIAVRGFQILLSLIIVGLAGKLIHDAYIDENGLAVAISVFTWLFVGYILVTELIESCRGAYHILAVMILDGLMVILWLATWAAVAAKRAQFVVPVDVTSCSDDGSLISSKTCWRKRELAKRGVLLFKTGASMMAAVAGLGALVWLLFVATFVWTIMQFMKGRKEGRFALSSSSTTTQPAVPATETYQMEPKPVEQPQQYQQPQYAMMQNQPPQGQYPPPAGTYPQAPYQPAVSPSSPQVSHPSPAAGGYPQDQQMYNQYDHQQPYPQQQYQPPTSPSPVTMPSQSPPPQEMAHQPYPAQQPQEMPTPAYHAPATREQ